MNENEKTETLLDDVNQVTNTNIEANPVSTSTPVTPTVAPSPVTSTPVTPTVAPSPVTSAPVTPIVTPSPVTSAPVTPTVAPSPVTSASVTPAAAPSPVMSTPVTPTVAPSPVMSTPVTPTVAPSPVMSTPVTPTVAPSSVASTSELESLNLTPVSQPAVEPAPVAMEPASVDVSTSVESDSDNNPELENTVITSAPITPEAIEEETETTPVVAPVSNSTVSSATTLQNPSTDVSSTSESTPVTPSASAPDVVGTIANPNEVIAATSGASTEGSGTTPPIDLNGGNFENSNAKLEPPKKGGVGKIIGLILIIAILGAVIIFLPDIQSFIVRQSNPVESEPTPTPSNTPAVSNTVLTCTLVKDDDLTGLRHTLTETYTGQNEELANVEIEEVITPIQNTTLDFATALENETSSCLLEMEKYPATSGVVATCDTTVSESLTRSFMYDLEQIKEYNNSLSTGQAPVTPTATATPSETPESVTQSPVQIEYSFGESITNIATAKQTEGYTCTTE